MYLSFLEGRCNMRERSSIFLLTKIQLPVSEKTLRRQCKNYTPESNMEPQKWRWMEDVVPFQRWNVQVPYLSFQGWCPWCRVDDFQGLNLCSHLKMDGWKMNFLLGCPIFRECIDWHTSSYIIHHTSSCFRFTKWDVFKMKSGLVHCLFDLIWKLAIHVHSAKLTQQWKMDPLNLNMYFRLKMVIFHCHVSFQGCTSIIQ